MGARPDDDEGFSSSETSVVVGNMKDYTIEARWPLRGAYTSINSSDDNYLYVVNYLPGDSNNLSVLDTDSGELLKHCPLERMLMISQYLLMIVMFGFFPVIAESIFSMQSKTGN